MQAKDWLISKRYDRMDALWEEAQAREKQMLQKLPPQEAYAYLVSKLNWCDRKQISSCQELGVHIRKGDICFVEYGSAYLCEIGYQHFGLILAIVHHKALIVPISGSKSAYQHAAHKKHVMRLGRVPGMNKVSVLYLNDAKWINTVRIIDVKAHLDTDSSLFMEVEKRIKEML